MDRYSCTGMEAWDRAQKSYRHSRSMGVNALPVQSGQCELVRIIFGELRPGDVLRRLLLLDLTHQRGQTFTGLFVLHEVLLRVPGIQLHLLTVHTHILDNGKTTD
ncbi:hypothetical protein EYF80_034842 [Liparis tanakae]|uniref:Uncharacterized protein n=1 Tax=Liparis tanakae TaxID=230148 RepID=A0A4Z2GQH7_9TELE|nr:hypothetical protein EYF80_034842 [Liparis tanakae]